MKKCKFLFIVLVLAMLSIGLIGCAPSEQPQDNAKIKIDQTELIIEIGETKTIKAQVLEQNAEVTWESSNVAVCSVVNGVVTAHNSGEAVISASASGETVYCIVEVRAPQQASTVGYDMTLNKYNLTLKVAETYTISAKVTDISGATVTGGTVSYLSSNESIATVSESGVITGIGAGVADITVKYTIGEDWVLNTIRVTISDDYVISITPFSSDLNIGGQLDLVYSITKGGSAYSYPAENITIYTSDSTVAVYENGKIKGLKAGYVTVTVLLNDINVKSMYSFAVLDPNAEAINLAVDSETVVFIGSSTDFNVKGASWGTLTYKFSDSRFYIENGKLYGPNEESTATVTVKHLETKQTVTATVKSMVFNPIITTAEQFLLLGGIKNTEVELGADIDLSDATWKRNSDYVYNAGGGNYYHLDVAYLIEKLQCKIDGKGHKITVRYDHEFGNENVQIGGLFLEISLDGGELHNTVIDFEARYKGLSGSNSDGTRAFKICAVAYANYHKVWDNFINAKYYADNAGNYSNRVVAIGYNRSTSVHRNIINSQVYKNNVLQQVCAGMSWETDPENNIKISAGLTSSSTNKFKSKDDFFTAWANTEITNQSTYTNWTVDTTNKTLKLLDTSITIDTTTGSSARVITTAEEFLLLDGVRGTTVELGADIDLTNATWKRNTDWTRKGTHLDVAYFIESLQCKIDGKGHKITVVFDNEKNFPGENVQIGGLFGHISSDGGGIYNTIIDFTAKYNGMSGVDGTGTAGFKVCAITMYNQGDVWDNYIDAKFYAKNSGSYNNRAVAIGYYGGSNHRNILNTKVYKNNVLQNPSDPFGWEGSGATISDNVVISEGFTSNDTNKFNSKDAFFTAWASSQITDQSTYTKWTVDTTNKTLKLINTQIVW